MMLFLLAVAILAATLATKWQESISSMRGMARGHLVVTSGNKAGKSMVLFPGKSDLRDIRGGVQTHRSHWGEGIKRSQTKTCPHCFDELS